MKKIEFYANSVKKNFKRTYNNLSTVSNIIKGMNFKL